MGGRTKLKEKGTRPGRGAHEADGRAHSADTQSLSAARDGTVLGQAGAGVANLHHPRGCTTKKNCIGDSFVDKAGLQGVSTAGKDKPA